MPFRFTFKDWTKCKDDMDQAILILLHEITNIAKSTFYMKGLLERVTR